MPKLLLFACFKMVPSASLGSHTQSQRVATGCVYEFWRNLAFVVGAFNQQFSGFPRGMSVMTAMEPF